MISWNDISYSLESPKDLYINKLNRNQVRKLQDRYRWDDT